MGMVLIWLLFAIFSAVIASNKGRSGVGWFLIGLLFGPFGLIVGFLSPLNNNNSSNSSEIQDLKALSDLRDNGTFSDAEYDTRKKEILSRKNTPKEYGIGTAIIILVVFFVVVIQLSKT